MPFSDEESEYSGLNYGDVLRDDDSYTEGDFTLISTDNVRFRVASRFILAASKVFWDMYGMGGDGQEELKIVFTDPGIETAACILLFLELAVHGELPCSTGALGQYPGMRELALFVDKYDCQQARNVLTNNLRLAILTARSYPLELFLIGATLDDWDLLILLLRHRSSAQHHREQANNAHIRALPRGNSVWAPHAWPKWFYDSCPRDAMFLLARAWAKLAAGGVLHHQFRRELRALRPAWNTELVRFDTDFSSDDNA